MADREWQGTTGDYSTAANWSGAAVPVAGDSVFFTGASVVSVTAGLAQGLVNLVEFNVGEDYTGTIAASGGKLVHDNITTVRINTRGGKVFLETDNTITRCIVEALGGADFFEIDGTVTLLDIIGATGSMSITAVAAVQEVNMMSSPSAILTINTGVTGCARINQDSGRIVNGSNVSTTGALAADMLLVTGGIHELTDAAAVALPAIVGSGGVILDRSSGTKTDVIALAGGLFDGRQNRNRPTVTITAGEVYPGGRILLRNALNSYSATITALGGAYDYETGIAK